MGGARRLQAWEEDRSNRRSFNLNTNARGRRPKIESSESDDTVTESESDDLEEEDIAEGVKFPDDFQNSYSEVEYWNSRYEKDASPFEWYSPWAFFRSQLADIFKDHKNVLHMGCGTSSFGFDLLSEGVDQVTNIDFSEAAIAAQLKRYNAEPRLIWKTMNASLMDFPKRSFDIAIEKGLIDSMMCSDVSDRLTSMLINSVSKVLRPRGVFISISVGSESLREEIFSGSQTGLRFVGARKIPRSSPHGEFIFAYILEKPE